MTRTVDKTKKSNIKCEHCDNWRCANYQSYCSLTASPTNYWNRCKHFEWAKGLTYKENDNETDN